MERSNILVANENEVLYDSVTNLLHSFDKLSNIFSLFRLQLFNKFI